MLDMYGIIIFFLFCPLLAWKWTFEDLAHDIHTFDLQPHDFFEFRTTEKVLPQSLPSSLESLLPLLTALSYYELQPPFVNALKAFLVKDSRMGYNFIWQILQSIN